MVQKKINASLIDIVLILMVVFSGTVSPNYFVISLGLFGIWFSIHLTFSKSTLKTLRKNIISKYIKGDE